jgi:hypothetical protein
LACRARKGAQLKPEALACRDEIGVDAALGKCGCYSMLPSALVSDTPRRKGSSIVSLSGYAIAKASLGVGG